MMPSLFSIFTLYPFQILKNHPSDFGLPRTKNILKAFRSTLEIKLGKGIFITLFKLGFIITILKASGPSNVSNYRLVTIICNFDDLFKDSFSTTSRLVLVNYWLLSNMVSKSKINYHNV